MDKKRLLAIKTHFDKIRPRYKEFLSNITGVDTEIFDSQIPGGMISNLESQLKQQKAGDRMKEVLEEVPRVREDAGFPPLVTPSSQIIGTQAVFNVMMGRYKVLTGEFADLMLGYYGETLGRRNRHVVELAAKQTNKTPIGTRPADLLKPEWQELRSAALAARWLQRVGRRRAHLRDVSGRGAEVLPHAREGPQEPGQGSGRGAGAGASRGSRAGGKREGPGYHHHHLRREAERPHPQGDGIARVEQRRSE